MKNKTELSEDEVTSNFYTSLSEALRMLDEDCSPLRFEVFLAYCQIIKQSDDEIIDHAEVMYQAMMEWDL